MSGDVVQVAIGLGERDEFGRARIGIEREKTVLFGQAEICGHFGGKGCAISLFLEQFGVDRRAAWRRSRRPGPPVGRAVAPSGGWLRNRPGRQGSLLSAPARSALT